MDTTLFLSSLFRVYFNFFEIIFILIVKSFYERFSHFFKKLITKRPNMPLVDQLLQNLEHKYHHTHFGIIYLKSGAIAHPPQYMCRELLANKFTIYILKKCKKVTNYAPVVFFLLFFFLFFFLLFSCRNASRSTGFGGFFII